MTTFVAQANGYAGLPLHVSVYLSNSLLPPASQPVTWTNLPADGSVTVTPDNTGYNFLADRVVQFTATAALPVTGAAGAVILNFQAGALQFSSP